MALRPIPGAPEGSTEDLGFPLESTPADHLETGTSEAPSHVPGLNRIGAMLDDLRKNIQQNQRWALKDWVEGAKLLVIATDVHGLTGDDYVQFACAHMPIEGKTQSAKQRAAYDLYLLGYAEEGQPSNGDLVIQECEAQAKLRRHNFEWPYWRSVTARLRREAKAREQGDGIPAGEVAEDTDADADEPDASVEDIRVDPVAQMDAENQKLRAEVDVARQSFKSERAAREEVQDALHRLRADITRILSSSEKAVWDAMPPPPPPEPPEKHTKEPEAEAVSETAPDPEPPTPNPEPPRTVGEAVSLIYRRRQTETCETVAEALHSVPMQDWERDDFDRLAEALDGCAQWYGDHNDIAHTLCSFETSPILFGTADGVLIYEDALKVLTWPEAMERIAPEVEEAKRKRELERRQQEMQRIIRTKLPAKRKLKAMKSLLDEVMALVPTTIRPKAARAIDFIRALSRDDERFAECRTFEDYLRKAAEIAAPPEPPKVLMLPPPEPPPPMSVPLQTDYDGEWIDVLMIEQEFHLPDLDAQHDARLVRFWFYRACKAAAETSPSGIAQQSAEWWLARTGCTPRLVAELWDIL